MILDWNGAKLQICGQTWKLWNYIIVLALQ